MAVVSAFYHTMVLRYADSVEAGWHAEEVCLADIQRKYYFHVDWHLLDHEEPAQPFRLYDLHAAHEQEVLMAEEAVMKRAHIEELDLVSLPQAHWRVRLTARIQHIK